MVYSSVRLLLLLSACGAGIVPFHLPQPSVRQSALVGFFFVGFPPWGGGLTMLVKFVMVKCRLVKKTQKIRLFSKLCLESVALWSVSAPGFFSRVSPDR